MNNYIHPENQKILWNTINKVQTFSQLLTPQKEELFKSVISLFYEKYKHAKLNNEQLKQLNKDTISIIIQHLKTSTSTPTAHQTASSPFQTAGKPTNTHNGFAFPEGPTTTHIISKESTALYGSSQPQSFDNVFKNRVNEYEMMSAKPKPPVDLDFSEKLDDEPISETNMSSIIQKHLKERENEMTLAYVPTTIVPPVAQPVAQAQRPPTAPPAPPIETNNELHILKQQMDEMRKEMKDEIQIIKELLMHLRRENEIENGKEIDIEKKNKQKNKDKEIAETTL